MKIEIAARTGKLILMATAPIAVGAYFIFTPGKTQAPVPPALADAVPTLADVHKTPAVRTAKGNAPLSPTARPRPPEPARPAPPRTRPHRGHNRIPAKRKLVPSA